MGKRDFLSVFGDDYDTVDGTGVRDYIHVVDLSIGHLQALQILDTPQCEAINLGTGNGYSVLEIVEAFAKASKRAIPYQIMPRRVGDIAACYADADKANTLLNWEATRDLDEMYQSSWHWQFNNPDGYST